MNRSLKVLIIDDDDLARRCISSVFKADNWFVQESAFVEGNPLEILTPGDWDLVICELTPNREYGLETFQRFAKNSPKTKVVLTTSDPNALGALDAGMFGVFEYLRKPLDAQDVHRLSSKLRQRFRMLSHAIAFGPLTKNNDQGGTLIGKSQPFLEIMRQVGRVAGTTLPVLLTGESGTGKEIVAATLHQRSSRCNQPFVAVNCGAIPSELIESELFGHEKGSFTGADRDRRGLWEEAAGGTIFLDEVTETSLSFQVKLLRTIQQGEIRRVGSNQRRHLDVRVIAACNRDVEQEVKAGRFRQDLFYRLNAVSIKLPPLRERKEDIPLLIEAFARRVSTNSKLRFSTEVLEILNHYPWPGNVRELEHAVIRSVAMCDGIVLAQDLPERIRTHWESINNTSTEDAASVDVEEWPTLAAVEADYVARALAHNNWNKLATARMLGIDRKTLIRMIGRHQIVQPLAVSKLAHDRRAA